MESGEYDIAFLPLRSDNLLPISFLEQFTTESKDNKTGFHSEAYDALFAQYSPFSSIEENNRRSKEMEQILRNEAVVLPVAYQSSFFVENTNVHDIFYSAETNLMFYSEAYIDQK